MISPMGACPAPSTPACKKAFGLAQHLATAVGHVPLNLTGWPATRLARRATFEPFNPTACEADAVSGAPVWKCVIALNDHPFNTSPSTPVILLPQGDSTVKLPATICVASKLNLP